jgi:hypothetical protein
MDDGYVERGSSFWKTEESSCYKSATNQAESRGPGAQKHAFGDRNQTKLASRRDDAGEPQSECAGCTANVAGLRRWHVVSDRDRVEPPNI